MPFATIAQEMVYFAGKATTRPDYPPLCFVHGAGGNSTHWLEQIRGLGRLGPVVAVDLPGHGQSQGSGRKTIRGYSQFVRQFIAHAFNGNSGIILAGHSMGGGIVMDYALQYPETLKGIVLIGTGAKLRVAPQVFEYIQAGPEFVADLATWFFSSSAQPELLEGAKEELSKVNLEVLYHDFQACDQFNLMKEISAIKVPALIICGQEDKLTPVKYAQYLRDHISESEISIIEKAGHMVMLEQPDQVNRTIERFLTNFKNRI